MSSTTELFLVRHGESTGNAEQRFTGWLDVPLSPRGVRQANAAGRALLPCGPFAAIFASDLRRAHDTAKEIAGVLSVPQEELRLRPGLRERSAGIFTGMPFEEAKRTHPTLWEGLLSREWSFMLPDGESNEAVSARLQAVLDEALSQHQGQRVLLVSHGIAISHMLRLLLRIDTNSFPRLVSFQSENASIHKLRLRDGNCSVAAINDTAHLTDIE